MRSVAHAGGAPRPPLHLGGIQGPVPGRGVDAQPPEGLVVREATLADSLAALEGSNGGAHVRLRTRVRREKPALPQRRRELLA